MSSLGNLDLCRLCLVKDRVSVPIFEGEGDVRQIFLKITACLPVKVNREDKLPKKICDDCVYKVELCYQFWHTTANAEKQLLQWLGEVNMEDKQGYNVLNPNGMKEQNNENRLDDTVMQQVSEHQNNMNMGMMDNMGLSMPIMMSSNAQQQITSVPMDNSGSSVQNVQPVAGPSTQTTHDQITQNQTDTPTQQEEEEESSEEEENSDDECDGDEGLPIKEESEEDPNNSRTIEPTTFVNVSLACDEAGPSGLQQQKIADMPEMVMSQTADVDPKTGEKPIIIRQKGAQYRKGPPRFVSILLGTWKSVQSEHNSTKTSGKLKPVTIQCRSINRSIKVDLSLDSQNSSVKTTKDTNNSIQKVRSLLNMKSPQVSGSLNLHKETTEVDEVMEEIRNTCPFCDKHFNNAKKVERHVRYVHRKPYQCDKCKRACYTPRALEEHKRIHRPDYFFECEICHVKYKSGDGLKRHYVRIHSDHEPRFVCEHCGRSYKLKIDLTHHMKRTHILELQICRFCGKKVKDVKGHEWRHQKRNREIKYEYPCHLCRKKFHHRSRLDNHLMLHEKGFKCEVCDKEYSGTRELMSHKRFKHGQTNISTCILCHKTFLSTSNFYQHVLTHASIRPYKCDICEKDFTQRSSLLRHRKHHPGPLPPLLSSHPQIAELARNYLEKFQSDHIDKTSILDA
ncbi:uncharacterized protein LOC143900399 isoform X5 [Temnothorax americanus]|uniref:uncharacterized protein LOC143900399 isoform X5 n=1 Tax=Temnothorax americanus TaxID=1964332 RepID=UPI004068EC81